MSSPVLTSAFDSETFGQDVSFHLEQPVGSMTISPSGRDVALASREGLHIIDLDSPYSTPRHLTHRTLWEVADVQWSPFASRDYWVVSTSNQKALVWNLAAKSWQDTIEFVLHGHTRAITDINFSAFNPDLLATCAVDSFIHCWDLRTPSRPALSFSDWFAGATQVKWSRQDEHVVASSHDKFLHIWDSRKGAVPVSTIEAHHTKIYGIDWNRFETNKIITCSLDRTIKFWDTSKPEDEPERVIDTDFPVWRARHTPFGWGMVAMPQRGSGDLFLYDRRGIRGQPESGHVTPVAKFQGHTGQVKEFLWRARGQPTDGIDHRDFQLISWGTDKELKLHRLDPEALENIGYVKGRTKTHRLRFTRKGARYKSYRDPPDDLSTPTDLPTRGESFPSQGALRWHKRRSTTVGMSKLPASLIRGWAADSRKSSRVGMLARGQSKADDSPLLWLKNVKIATWDPDTLAEEIRHVAEKFKKVQFETVDVKNRKVIMALQAPWAEHQESIYVRVNIRFPQAYPGGANAIITVQKSGAMASDLHKTLSKDLHTIADAYAAQRKGCLEAVLRYLLREQSLDQIVTWVMGESVMDSRTIPEDDSSDSDDDQLDGMGVAVAASAANLRVPLAKGCGALWSKGGKLVCFFPPKRTEPESILSGLSVQNLEGSESSKLFEGFGWLNHESTSRAGTNGAATADSNSDSDSSDSVFESSTSSSTSSEPATELPGATLPFNKHLGVLRQRSHSIGMSNQSTTLAGAKVTAAQRKTIVAIHDFEDLLPTRKELAQQYILSGDRAEACRHNAKVASEAGHADLAHVWNLASMILECTVPLEFAAAAGAAAAGAGSSDRPLEDILVVARSASRRIGRGREKAHSGGRKNITAQTRGQIKWGANPLASSYLVRAMFTYYERLADVQMLAMLSSIFSEVSLDQEALVSISGVTRGAPSIVHRPSARTSRYYSSSTVAKAMLLQQQQDAEVDGFVMVPKSHSPQLLRMGSSVEEGVDGFSVSMKAEAGHGDWNRTAGATHEDPGSSTTRSATISLSASPDGNRSIPSANFGAILSDAHSSLSALTQSFPHHSSPSHGAAGGAATSLKKYSPSGSSLAPGWGLFSSGQSTKGSRTPAHYSESLSQDRDAGIRAASSFANLRSVRRDGRFTPEANLSSMRSSFTPVQSSGPTRRSSPVGVRNNRIFKVSLHHQDKFDLENHPVVPLLDTHSAWRYRAYRASYIHLLEGWELYSEMAEMRKIDELAAAKDTRAYATATYRMRMQTLKANSAVDNDGLQVRRCCRNCGHVLVAVEKNGIAIGWDCTNAACVTGARRRVSKKSSCSLCSMVISGRSTPCLQCGHLVCQECARSWYGQQQQNHRHKAQKPHDRRRSSSRLRLTGVVASPNSLVAAALPTSLKATGETTTRTTTTSRRRFQQHEAECCPTGCGCPCSSLKSIQIQIQIAIASADEEEEEQEEGELGEEAEHGIRLIHYRPRTYRKTSHPYAVSGVPASSSSFGTMTNAAAAGGGGRGGGRGRGRLPPYMSLTRQSTMLPQSSAAASSSLKRGSSMVAMSAPTGPAAAVAAVLAGQDDVEDQRGTTSTTTTRSTDDADESLLNPWFGSKLSTLGRGIGGGLSRGLREKASDSTIRRVG